MIITCVPHGRQSQDARRLAAHLSKTKGQMARIVESSGLAPGLGIAAALEDLRRMMALSKRSMVGFQHLTINPAIGWSEGQRDEAIRRVLAELGAADHAWTLVEHAEKERACSGGAPTHWHLVVAHVGPTGRALNMRDSFGRLEAVARSCEADFGEPLTPTRRASAVARHLGRMGREDVAIAVRSQGAGPPPRSAMTSTGRARADRLGFDLPAIRATVETAWQSSDLLDSLASFGLRLSMGRKPGVVVVTTPNGLVAGALDRLAHVPRATVVARLEGEMARPRKAKGTGDDQRNRQQANDGETRKNRVARRSGDQSDGGVDSRPPVATGLARPRFAGPHRSEVGHNYGAPDAALHRRRHALREQKIADAIAREREGRGRSIKEDVETTKAALWRRLFGADLSPALVSALYYVDVQARLVKLTGGGWVRDAGNTMYASGAEAEVVSLLVEAAKAKGWQAVRVWGPPEFIAECRRQFEAAGMPVSLGEEPPQMIAPSREPTNSPTPVDVEDVIAQLRRRIEYADRQLEDIRKSGSSGDDVAAAEMEERSADTTWRDALKRREAARLSRKQAETTLAEAGYFARARARRALQDARASFDTASETLDDAVAAHEKLKSRLAATQTESKDRERRRRAKLEPEERSAEARRQFAIECLETIERQPALAAQGIDVVEKATEEAGERSQLEASGGKTVKP